MDYGTLLDARFLGPFIASLFSLPVAVFVLKKSKEKVFNRILAGTAFASLLYNIFKILFFFYPSIWIARLGWIGSIALIPLFIDFPDALLENMYARPIIRKAGGIITFLFVLSLPTELMFRSELDGSNGIFVALSGPLMKFYASVMAIVLIRMAFRLIKARFRHPDEMMRRRVEFILLGELFYCVCAMHDMLLRHQVMWVFPFPIIEWATLFFMIIVVYATMRYKLLDMDLVLGIGVYYTFLTLSVAIVYKAAETLIENYLEKTLGGESLLFSLIPALMVSIFMGPISRMIQRVADKHFLERKLLSMKIFKSPNFQSLVLDSRIKELGELRDEIDVVIAYVSHGTEKDVNQSG